MELVVAGCCAMREDFDWSYPSSKETPCVGSKDQALCAFRKLFFGVARLASIANRIGTNPNDRERIGEALDVLHADWSGIMAFVSALHHDGKVLSSQVSFLVSKLSLLSRSFEASIGRRAPVEDSGKGPAWQEDVSGLPPASTPASCAAPKPEANCGGGRARVAVPIEVVHPPLPKKESEESLPAEGWRFEMSCTRRLPAETSTPRMKATFENTPGRQPEPLLPVQWPDDEDDSQLHTQHNGSANQLRPSTGTNDQLISRGDAEGLDTQVEGDAGAEQEAQLTLSVASSRNPGAAVQGAASAPASVRAPVAAAYLRALSPTMQPAEVRASVHMRPAPSRRRSTERSMISTGYVPPAQCRHRSLIARSENESTMPQSPRMGPVEDERATLLRRGTVGQRVSALESKLRESQASKSSPASPSHIQRRTSRPVDYWYGSKSRSSHSRRSPVLAQARNASA